MGEDGHGRLALDLTDASQKRPWRDSNTTEHNAQSALNLHKPRNYADFRGLERHRATPENRSANSSRAKCGQKSLINRASRDMDEGATPALKRSPQALEVT